MTSLSNIEGDELILESITAVDADTVETILEARANDDSRSSTHDRASLALSADANVEAVQRTVGHASATMTLDVCADLFDDDIDTVADALDEAKAESVVAKMWPHE